MLFKREKYLNALIASQQNGLVKIITGVRRCGKSFLLFTLWHDRLLQQGVPENHIIEISLDDFSNRALRDPGKLLDYIKSRIVSDNSTNYVVLDEVQLVDNFVEVILSLTHIRNVDVYVSGSNSHFLSSDVVTEFRGRGDEIRVWPLTFSEYYEQIGGDMHKAWRTYYTYGGLPQVALLESETKKIDYLHNLYQTTYLRDVIERNHLRNAEGMETLIRVLASVIGSSTNPTRIANTFLSSNIAIKRDTIDLYIGYLKDSFLVEEALRYNIKGRKYIGTETKYYFVDMGLRAAILNYRQQDEPHIMENIIYNELRSRGYQVDVGLVEFAGQDANGVFSRKNLEVDFVVNRPPGRVYIQSAFRMPTPEKEQTEQRSLLAINDYFRKIIVVGDDIQRKEDENGVVTISLFDFLIDHSILESVFL